jgi:hypothetical protein
MARLSAEFVYLAVVLDAFSPQGGGVVPSTEPCSLDFHSVRYKRRIDNHLLDSFTPRPCAKTVPESEVFMPLGLALSFERKTQRSQNREWSCWSRSVRAQVRRATSEKSFRFNPASERKAFSGRIGSGTMYDNVARHAWSPPNFPHTDKKAKARYASRNGSKHIQKAAARLAANPDGALAL